MKERRKVGRKARREKARSARAQERTRVSRDTLRFLDQRADACLLRRAVSRIFPTISLSPEATR